MIDEEDAREVARAVDLKVRGSLYVLKDARGKVLISKEESIETLDDMINKHKILNDATIDVIILPSPHLPPMPRSGIGIYS
ncbi:hypothetical protein C5S29_08700 [ANME-1 cluster archaeon GoMg3.2]|nr:hypothetical protein [ANME-1 cluster archaeon GoMg3.2]